MGKYESSDLACITLRYLLSASYVGIDICGPVGALYVFHGGNHFGYNPEPGDYGNVKFPNTIWAESVGLYGHLSDESIERMRVGKKISRGEVLHGSGIIMRMVDGASMHFQLSLVEPTTHDLPGVVFPPRKKELSETIRIPD